MARCCCSVVVLLIGFLAGAAAVAGGAGPLTTGRGCEVSTLAAELAASCTAGDEEAVTPPCCEPVAASVELGTACFCRAVAEMPVLHAGLNASALLALYTRCGGARLHPACDAVAGPTTASGAGVVRSLSSTVVDSDVPDVAGAGVTQPPPPQQQTRTFHLSSKDRKVLIGIAACQMFQLPVVVGIGMRMLYRRCYGPK